VHPALEQAFCAGRSRQLDRPSVPFSMLCGSLPENYGPDLFSKGAKRSRRQMNGPVGYGERTRQRDGAYSRPDLFAEDRWNGDRWTGLFGVRGGGGWTDRFRPWWTSLWFVSGERSRLRDRPFLQGGRKERSSIGQAYRGRERGRYHEGSGGRGGRQMNGQTFSLVVCNGTGLLGRCRCRSAVRE